MSSDAEDDVRAFLRRLDADQAARDTLVAALAGEISRNTGFTERLKTNLETTIAAIRIFIDIIWENFWSRFKIYAAVIGAEFAALGWFAGGQWISDVARSATKEVLSQTVESQITVFRTQVQEASRAASQGLSVVQETVGRTRERLDQAQSSATALQMKLEGIDHDLVYARQKIKELEDARQNLQKMIEGETARNVFIKLQADHYRLRDVRLEARYFGLDPDDSQYNVYFNNVAVKKTRNSTDYESIAEFRRASNDVGVMRNDKAVEHVEVAYEPFFMFRSIFRSQLLDVFDDISRVIFIGHFRYSDDTNKKEAEDAINRLKNQLSALEVDLVINGTAVALGRFEKYDCKQDYRENEKIINFRCSIDLEKSNTSFRTKFDKISESWLAQQNSKH